jgi:L-rhamnose mutarotase
MKENYVYGVQDRKPNKVITSATVEIKEESDKDLAMKLFDGVFERISCIMEETFLESADGNLFSCVFLDEKEYVCFFYMGRNFYDKHVGKLVHQQSIQEWHKFLMVIG